MSFVGLFSISTMTLIITYLVRKGFTTIFVLFVLVSILTILYGLQAVLTKSLPSSISLNQWLLLFGGGIASAIGNYGLYRATALSPNPGLVITIFGLQGGIVAVAAVWLFKDKLNLVQIIGILLGVIAVIIIGLGSRSNKPDVTTANKAHGVEIK